MRVAHTYACVMNIISSKEELLSMQKLHKHVICIFSAEWCRPCQNLKADLKDFTNETTDIAWAMVDVDKAELMCSQYNVQQIPRVLFYKGEDKHGDLHGPSGKDVIETAKKNGFM